MVVIANRYSKLTRAIPVAMTTATIVLTIFLNDWRSYYGIPAKLLNKTGPHFASTFYETISVELEITPLTIKEYHPQSNGPV